MRGLGPGIRMTIRMMEEWGDNEPPGADSKQKGIAPRDRMASIKQRRQREVAAKQVAGYNRARERSAGLYAKVSSELEDVESALAELVTRQQQGLATPDEVQKFVAEAIFATNAWNKDLTSVERDAEAAVEALQLEPAEFEAQWLKKFPILQQSLPLITEDWLLGEDDRDPLGGAR